MAMSKDVKAIKKLLELICETLTGTGSEESADTEYDKLIETYDEYKYFADSRGQRLLEKSGLVDEYNTFMSACEDILFSDIVPYTFELPQPSEALEAFKNKFQKFFK